ncbi:MAG: KH domain-containing protein [Chloroflexia bacterium]
MEELILYIARQLVDHPESVQVRQAQGRKGIVYRLSVSPKDKGKIIGKDGRIIAAIREIVDAAAARQRREVTLEVV